MPIRNRTASTESPAVSVTTIAIMDHNVIGQANPAGIIELTQLRDRGRGGFDSGRERHGDRERQENGKRSGVVVTGRNERC